MKPAITLQVIEESIGLPNKVTYVVHDRMKSCVSILPNYAARRLPWAGHILVPRLCIYHYIMPVLHEHS
jgi:hypothetical protein